MRPARVAYSASFVAGIVRKARAELADVHAYYQTELASVRAEVAELRDIVTLMVSIRHQRSTTDVSALQQLLEVAIARLERDRTRPLN